MRATSEILDDNKVRIAVAIDEQEVEVALASTAKTLARDLRIPGFRPGRAPRPVVEARIGGARALRDEALRELLPDYYARALSVTEVEPLSTPELKVTNGDEEGPVEFDAVVEVRPLVQVAGYDKLRVTIPSPMVTDDEVDEMVDRQRDPDAVLEAVSRPIVTGDYVTMDVRGRIEAGDEVVNVDDYVYIVGQGSMVDEADDQLPGMRGGETLEVAGTAPGGSSMSFTLVLKEVREKRLPDLTDEWVAENTESETVQDLRDKFMAEIRAEKVRLARRYMRDATMAELATQIADADVPDALVEREAAERFREFQQTLEGSGMSYDDFFRISHQDPEEFANVLREEAHRGAKVDLALRAVAAQEQLEPTAEELDAELERLAKSVRRTPTKLREDLERNGRLGALRAEKAKSLAADFVMEHVTYVDPTGAEIDSTLLEGGPDDGEADSVEGLDALDQSEDEVSDTTEDA
ncbi:MAG TPA: trigger factor [Acidimicrobiales bacterium]|jgi:trigger factor|nr:trigger factor [Acidimicrobiales bacterium]